MRHSSRASWLVCAFLAGCTAASAPDTSTSTQAIIGGSPSSTDTAVVLFASYPTDMSTLDTCTAVLVAPSVLLTAAHCVDAPNHPSYTFGIFPGEDASAYTTLAELEPHLLTVSAVYPEPDYMSTPPYNADIAVAVLAAPLTGVTPLPIARTAPSPSIVNGPARIVGYGETTEGTANYERNAATTVVAAIDTGSDTITVGDSTHLSCLGDSGGPAIVNGVVLATDSYTDTSGCTEPAHYTRVDEYTAFVEMYAPSLATDAGPTAARDGGPGGSDVGDAGTGGGNSGGGCDAGGTGGAGAGSLLAMMIVAMSIVRARVRRG